MTKLNKEVRVAIAGLGVVGCGLIDLIERGARFQKQGVRFTISGVTARNRGRKRPVPTDHYRWVDDPVALATDPATDIFIELIGGADGPAKASVEAALAAGKPVITANKALIAEHGAALAQLAEEKGTALKFEAAVAGGTPVVRGIKGGAAACDVSAVRGILNGTCNYILSTMAETGAPFDDVLLEAQKAGFAEADPSFDVDGIDAAHKLAILATVGFDAHAPMSQVQCRGIRDVSGADVEAAKQLGYSIKLIGEAVLESGRLGMRVTPAMIPQTHPFAKAMGSENVVTVDASPLGRLSFNGPGAGAGATASAVAADLREVVSYGIEGPVYAVPATDLAELDIFPTDQFQTPYFFRVDLKDEPGAVAAVTDAFARERISIESLQQQPGDGKVATLVVITHPTTVKAAAAAFAAFADAPFVAGGSNHLPIITP